MNVLNIFYTFNQGGVERLGISISNCFADSGVNAYVCIISENYSDGLIDLFSEKVKILLLKKQGVSRKLGYLKQLVDIIRKYQINVVHVHQGNLMPFYSLIKILCPKIKIYLTIHDTYIYSELSYINQKLANIVCNKIIAISDAVANDMRNHGALQEKIVRVYNGVDFNKFPIRKRGEEYNNREKIKIINVARFVPKKKGQDLLIKALAEIKKKGYSAQIYFVGGEPSGVAGEIQRMHEMTRELNVEDDVFFLGNVDDVSRLLNEADIFCIPSRYEGFGISAVEAMGVGLPCVASNIIGLNEVVNCKYLGELFSVDDEKDLADKLINVINRIDNYDTQKIAQNVRERFSIENMMKSLLVIYQE